MFVYYLDPDTSGSIRRVPVGGGEEVEMSRSTELSAWDRSAEGLYLSLVRLTLSARGSEYSIEYLDLDTRLRERLSCGEGATARSAASPDERWILYHRHETLGSELMRVENFR